jgi:hypothetical protein
MRQVLSMVDSPKIFHGNNFPLYIFGVVIPSSSDLLQKLGKGKGVRAKGLKFKQKVAKTIDFLFLQEFYYSRLIFETIFILWELRPGNLVTISEATLSFYRL